MSYDINIFSPQELPDLASTWLQHLNKDTEAQYSFHPEVSFSTEWTGFWPIKVTKRKRWFFSRPDEFMSGFEMYTSIFDFDTYFGLNCADRESRYKEVASEGLDLEVWQTFRSQILISFSPQNRFEADLAFSSASILTQVLEGMCSDPQTGEEIFAKDVANWAQQKSETFYSTAERGSLRSYRFEGWK